MEKNNRIKYSRIIYYVAVVCLIALFSISFILIGADKKLVHADSAVFKSYVANDYFAEDQAEVQKRINSTLNNISFEADATSMDNYCLRDDYVIYTQDQGYNGLCWSFASNMALGTTFMVSTGQFYDFSEAWIGLARAYDDSTYLYGAGGNASTFNSIVKKYGLVLESDLQYNESYLMCKEDIEAFYSMYSSLANKELFQNVQAKTYGTNTKANRDLIKNHIYNNGALNIGMYWNTAIGYSGVVDTTDGKYSYKAPSARVPGDSSAHAISLIGWDDKVKITYNSRTYTGAWICLNSWGDTSGKEGVLYVCYDDSDLFGYVDGYTYTPTTTDLYYQNEIETGYSSYRTAFNGKYYSSSNYTASTNSTKQKNMFFENDVTAKYSYTLTDDAKIDNIFVYYGQEDVTNSFTIQKDTTNKELTVSADNIKAGAYKVVVNYSNSTDKEQYVNVIYVLEENEVTGVGLICQNDAYEKFIYNSYNYQDMNLYVTTTEASGSVLGELEYATYSNVSSTNKSLTFNYSGLSSTNNVYKYTKTIKSNSGKTLTIVVNVVYRTSNEKQVFFYYDLNGGVNSNAKKLAVNTTSGVTLNEPTRIGYVFEGWYYDSALTQKVENNIYKFENVIQLKDNFTVASKSYYTYVLKEPNVAFAYANWTEEEPTISLFISDKLINAGQKFFLNLQINHTLANLFTLESVKWYKDGVEISNSNVFSLEQTLTDQGSYNYHAEASISINGNAYSLITNSVSIIVLKTFEGNISYSGGVFSWNAMDDVIKYIVKIYYNDRTNDDQVLRTFDTTENQTSLPSELITAEGRYSIGVSAVSLVGGVEYSSLENKSAPIDYYKISFVTYTSAITDKIIEGNTLLLLPTVPEKTGYTFRNWYTDAQKTTTFDQSKQITSDLTLYAYWKMNDILNIDQVAGVEKTYDANPTIINVLPSHESGLTNFTYKWFYLKAVGDEPTELQGQRSHSIKVINVADSGVYYCVISLTDSDGFGVTNQTNYIVVAINRFNTIINTENVKRTYTFSGKEQTIDGGAVAEDENGNVISNMELEYEIKEVEKRSAVNKFIYVPIDGYFTLIIKALGNENYDVAETTLEISVKKLKQEFTITKPYQFFNYNGKTAEPEYKLPNEEQHVVIQGQQPKDQGEYDVKIVALDSRNYLETSANVHITIRPANIKIVVNDVSAVLFGKMKKLSYYVSDGEIYNNDDLGVVLHAEVDMDKIGTYAITATATNQNYKVGVVEGKYVVSGWPYYLAVALLILLVFFVIKLLSQRRYQYDFETNGGSVVKPIETKHKKEITLDVPTREGYRFVGWYTDMELTKPFNQNYKKSKGKMLYAKWEKVEGELSVSEQLRSAQQIVDSIQSKVNPKKEEAVDNTKVVEEKTEEKPKEKTKEEKMQDLIDSVDTKEEVKPSKEMDDFIKRIVDEQND